MVSRPPFIVEMTRAGAQTLAVQCMFPMDKYPEAEQMEGQEGEFGMYIITLLFQLPKFPKWNIIELQVEVLRYYEIPINLMCRNQAKIKSTNSSKK